MTDEILASAHRKLADALRAAADAVEALGDPQLPQPKDRALPYREIAALMGRKVSSVYRAVEAKELRARILGGEAVVLLSDFHDFLRRLPVRSPRRVPRVRAGRPIPEDGGTAQEHQK